MKLRTLALLALLAVVEPGGCIVEAQTKIDDGGKVFEPATPCDTRYISCRPPDQPQPPDPPRIVTEGLIGNCRFTPKVTPEANVEFTTVQDLSFLCTRVGKHFVASGPIVVDAWEAGKLVVFYIGLEGDSADGFFINGYADGHGTITSDEGSGRCTADAAKKAARCVFRATSAGPVGFTFMFHYTLP